MEVLDVYDDNGNVINKTVLRGSGNKEFGEHEHFAVSIIFLENDKGEFLIQRIPKGQYSSTGGHILSKEKPIDAIIRETKEEIGVSLDKNEIVDLGFRLLDFPIRFLFYVKKDVKVKDVTLQKEEVCNIKYMSVDRIEELIKKNSFKKGHALLFREILKYKNNTPSINDIFVKYKDNYDIKFKKNNPNVLRLKINNYKILISSDKIRIFKNVNDEWIFTKKYTKIKGYNELCDLLDKIVHEYERK